MQKVICVSRAQAEKVRRLGVRAERIQVIHNSIDDNRFNDQDCLDRQRLLEKFPATSRARVKRIVGAAGRLSPEKGFDVLVEAAARVIASDEQVGFVHFGNGPMKQELTERIETLGIADRFVLAGFTDELDRFMPNFDLFVQSSHTEGLPNVLLEALAAQVAVVATDVGGTREVLDGGNYGQLVQAGRPAELAKAILDLIEFRHQLPGTFRSAMGRESIHIWSAGGRVLRSVCLDHRSSTCRSQRMSTIVKPQPTLKSNSVAIEPAVSAATRQKTNVCFLIDNLNRAGTENHLLQLIRDLDRSRFHPVLVLLDGQSDVSRSLEPENCEVVRLGLRSFFRASAIGSLLRFSKWLKQHQIDVLQLHFPDSSLFGAIAGRLAGVPCIVRTRRNSGYWMTRMHRWRGRLVSWLADVAIANSQASRESVIVQEHAMADTVTVIPNGVDLERFDFSGLSLRRRTPVRRIGMLTNLRPVKRVDDFIRAAAKLADAYPDMMFAIAGDGPQRRELEWLIKEHRIQDQVELFGPTDDVPGFLAMMDALVICSESEGLSNSMLEGMASGLPIIATDIAGNRSVVADEKNGLLVPVGDVSKLANAIERLYLDEALAGRLGDSARRFVADHLTHEIMMDRYQSFYLEALQQKRQQASQKTFGWRIKSWTKAALFWICWVITAPLWMFVLSFRTEQAFLTSAQLISVVPGLVGVFLRRAFYWMTLDQFSRDCHIDFGTWFSHRQVRIGKRVYIGARCLIGMAEIGQDVLIGSNVDVLSGKNQHHFENPDLPIRQQGGRFEQVRLERGCWIGNSSVVMDHVGAGSIVGAGSVVVKPVDAKSIAAGNPAKVIRKR